MHTPLKNLVDQIIAQAKAEAHRHGAAKAGVEKSAKPTLRLHGRAHHWLAKGWLRIAGLRVRLILIGDEAVNGL